MVKKIRIRTKLGKMIERRAEVVDRIDGYGTQYSLAQVGIRLYRVVERDSEGPIYKAVGGNL